MILHYLRRSLCQALAGLDAGALLLRLADRPDRCHKGNPGRGELK